MPIKSEKYSNLRNFITESCNYYDILRLIRNFITSCYFLFEGLFLSINNVGVCVTLSQSIKQSIKQAIKQAIK